VAALLAGSTASLAKATTPTSSKSGKVTTATWAEAPLSPPNYIFPFMGLQYFNVSNINQFQYLMFRPLYWFGVNATPNLNLSLSLAKVPKYSNQGTSVTISLRSYRWSNGEDVSSQDVMFWMNMLHAEKQNWADYSPGSIPDGIKGITIDSPTQLTFTLAAPVNSAWFTGNELSQITPMPLAWDVSAAKAAAGTGGCSGAAYGTADAPCDAVYRFLSKQAGFDPANPNAPNGALGSYASNPLWQVVDGPWKLSQFDTAGNVTMTANSSYSGPVKPTVTTFKEIPFASSAAEFKALASKSLSVGYLPTENLTSRSSTPTQAAGNNARLGAYHLDPLYFWGVNYFPYNFQSTGDDGNAGAIFSQLYFRQAFQSLVDQSLYVAKIYKGFAIADHGPIPRLPKNGLISAYAASDPYPYNSARAKQLLTSHGWKVKPGGTSYCVDPGTGTNQCGKGIALGAKLAFNLEYAAGTPASARLMDAERSSWSQAGIDVTLTSAPFNTVLSNAAPCNAADGNCSWELENWGVGWIYEPNFYPTGEAIFQTGGSANVGSYSDPINDKNIVATTSTEISLTRYQNYLAQQLPVIWQPNAVASLTEIRKGLKGVTPQNPLWQINPENWRF
jgi:peptide/nickel transport system substrate-binding protein